MAFIRAKNIGGKQYAYLVENRWEAGRAKQSVSQYLGKIIEPEKKNASNNSNLEGNYKEAVARIIDAELLSHGFMSANDEYTKESITIKKTDWSVLNKGKPAVLKLNSGFFCKHTANELHNMLPAEDDESTGVFLAKKLVDAGINVEKDAFVKLFEKIAPKEEKQ